MKKPFFFRIEAGALLDFATDPEGEGITLLRFAKDLQKGESDIPFIQQVIDEARGFIEKKANAGKKGMKNRWLPKNEVDNSVITVLSSVITNDNTVITNDNTPITSSSSSNSSSNIESIKTYSSSADEVFSVFWNAYPKKVGKDAALKAWKKIKSPSETLGKILMALEWQVKSEAWTKDGGQYIPNPATYLNQGRWKDEPTTRNWSNQSSKGVQGTLARIEELRAKKAAAGGGNV